MKPQLKLVDRGKGLELSDEAIRIADSYEKSVPIPKDTCCPYCGISLHRSGCANGDRPNPEPRDFTICARCAEIAVFGDDLKLRKPKPGELQGAPARLRADLERAQADVREWSRARLAAEQFHAGESVDVEVVIDRPDGKGFVTGTIKP